MTEFIAKQVILKDNDGNYLIPYTGGGGASLPVGTIFAHSASATFVPENSLPCDGHEYSKTQFDKLYTDWLVGKKLATCTYEEYQQEITNTGECLKFGIDTVQGKFKVPTKKNQIVSGVTATGKAPVVGNGMTLGLTNGTTNYGLAELNGTASALSAYTGSYGDALKKKHTGTAIPNADDNYGVTTDASKSGIVADLSNSLDVKTKEIRYFVVVATGSIKQSEMDWSQWASSLAGKANKNLDNVRIKSAPAKQQKDLSWLGLPVGQYTAITFPYAPPCDGWMFVEFYASGTGVGARIIDENSTPYMSASGQVAVGQMFPVYVGHTYSFTGQGRVNEAWFIKNGANTNY